MYSRFTPGPDGVYQRRSVAVPPPPEPPRVPEPVKPVPSPSLKQRLNTGESTSVNEAVRKTGLSRSAYYKYKDSVLPFYEAASGKKVTLLLSVENFQGILSEIIRTIAESRANILTINQNIPINGLADISISIETVSMYGTVDDIINDISKLAGVRKCMILSRE